MRKMIRLFVILVCFVMALTVDVLAAAQYSIKTMTPEVEKALVSRRDRYDQLSQLKAKGTVGETNNGYLKAFNDDKAVVTLVTQENADRRIVYQTIAQQNDLTNALEIIEKVFGGVQRDKADIGEMIQTESGDWAKKK